jgi:SAM-dependent methyltransferase
MTETNPAESNASERRRWNDDAWTAAWPNRERLTSTVTGVLLDHLGLAQGERVLDVGSGGGWTSIAAGRQVGPQGEVVGADISGPLVALARRRAIEEGATNVHFVVCDVQRDDVPGSPFSAAMSQFGVMFFDEPVTAFTNIASKLDRRSRLSFACWQPLELNPWFVGHAVGAYLPPLPDPPAGKARTGPFALSDAAHTDVILAEAGWRAVVNTPYEMTATVPKSTIVDAAQLAFMGVPDDRIEPAAEAAGRYMDQFDRGDDRYELPIAFRIVSAVRAG